MVVQVVDGRLTLPVEVRARLRLLPRDPLVFSREGGALVAVRATVPAAARAPRRAARAPVRPLGAARSTEAAD